MTTSSPSLPVHRCVRSSRTGWAWSLLFAAALLHAPSPPARACATIAQVFSTVNGRLDGAQIAQEQAVIIWDEARHTEHFIRQADIRANAASSLGFLVPTPQTPELAEADAKIFTMAQALSEPRRIRGIEQVKLTDVLADVIMGPLQTLGAKTAMVFSTVNVQLGAVMGVEVVHAQRVAGFDVVVLAANDADALARWLQTNGYQWNASLADWLRPYVVAQWKITAFKLAAEPGGSVSTGAVRMSFATEAPFFPYREPKSAQPRNPGGLLSVAILSNRRMTGALAEGKPWPAEVEFAGPVAQPIDPAYTPDQWLEFAHLDPAQATLPSTLTTFRDVSTVRPGETDLFFYPAADQAPLRREVVDPGLRPEHRIAWSGPMDLVAMAVFVLVPLALIRVGFRVFRMTGEERSIARLESRQPVDQALVFIYFLLVPVAFVHLLEFVLATMVMPPLLLAWPLYGSIAYCAYRLQRPARVKANMYMGLGSMALGLIFVVAVVGRTLG